MNKKLITLAIGATMAAAPMMATAGATWYGHLQAEIANEDATNPGGTDGKIVQGGGGRFQNDTTVEDNKRGRLGVKGSEKLGNGLTAIYKMEWQVSTVKADIDDGDRNAFVGLKGSFGTVKIGSLKSPYKYYGGVKYDPFVTTNIEARRYGGMTTGKFGHNSFFRDSISYISPKMNNFQLWAVYSPDDVDGTDGDYSVGVKYKQKPFEIFAATASDDSANYDAWKIGGAIKFGNHKIKGQYEDLDNNGTDGQLFFVGWEGKFGNNVMVAQFGDGESETPVSQDSQYFAIGVIHKMSKTTRAFAGYGDMDVDNAGGVLGANGDRDAFTVGLRIDFK